MVKVHIWCPETLGCRRGTARRPVSGEILPTAAVLELAFGIIVIYPWAVLWGPGATAPVSCLIPTRHPTRCIRKIFVNYKCPTLTKNSWKRSRKHQQKTLCVYYMRCPSLNGRPPIGPETGNARTAPVLIFKVNQGHRKWLCLIGRISRPISGQRETGARSTIRIRIQQEIQCLK